MAARGHFPVWIQGEPGSDKETIARLIHEHSEWASGAFFALDASVVPGPLLGRELFGTAEGEASALGGHTEGALRRLRSGTVLIDNVEELPKELQQTLASALERGELRPLGSATTYPVQARVIAASARPLEALIADGRIAQELAERLRLLEIVIPALRDRREDILPLAAQELAVRAAEIEHESGARPSATGFTREAIDRLRSHNWPGDERELRKQIRDALALARGPELGAEDLMLSWESSSQVPSFREAKRSFEQEYVTRVLRLCGGNISRAARIARKDRKDFYDVMRRNGINPTDFRS